MVFFGGGIFGWFGDGTGGGGGGGGGYTPSPQPRVLTETAWINNAPVEAWGMRLLRHSGWLSAAATPTPAVSMMPGMSGGGYTTLQAATPLELVLEGNFLELDFDQREAAANAVATGLRGLLEIRFADAPTHVLRGVAGPVQWTPLTDRAFVPRRTTAVVKVTIPISCADSARYARHARQLVLGTTPRAIPTGSLASGGEVWIPGPFTGDVDIECLAPQGYRLYRLALVDLDIADGGFVRVRFDNPRGVVLVDPDGSQSSILDQKDDLRSDRWWKVPAFYSAPAVHSWCALRVSTGTALYRYTMAWEH